MKFDRKIAENLFMGVVSDSDRFLISYTTSKTFKLIAELIDKSQIDFTKLYSNLYERPYSEIKFHGYLSDNLNITENGFAYLVITPEILKEYNVDSATPSNMINDFSNIRGVYVWMFATYDERNEIYKVNIRSKGPVINDTAAMYGGGGHKYASGARIRDKEEINKLIKSLDEECIQYKESLLSD
jgi:phosphoesterase RecJ-like protein